MNSDNENQWCGRAYNGFVKTTTCHLCDKLRHHTMEDCKDKPPIDRIENGHNIPRVSNIIYTDPRDMAKFYAKALQVLAWKKNKEEEEKVKALK